MKTSPDALINNNPIASLLQEMNHHQLYTDHHHVLAQNGRVCRPCQSAPKYPAKDRADHHHLYFKSVDKSGKDEIVNPDNSEEKPDDLFLSQLF